MPDATPGGSPAGYALRDVLGMYPKVREYHVRSLQKFGLIHPVASVGAERQLTFADLLVIRQASAELEQGAPFRAVVRDLQASQSGQLALNFRLDPEPAKILRLRRVEQATAADATAATRAAETPLTSVAEEYFQQGSALDQGDAGAQDAAAAAYRRALEMDPYLVAALINLANLHYAKDHLPEAQSLYERALRLEPGFFEAHFNLGNIHHDLGCYAEAATCYRDALALNPGYPDAHFYLAVTLEKMGHSHDARPHWRQYQQLAPDGEWVDLAREFSE
jgi:tetratricopeptide (TPR) repeat protein